MHSYIIVFPVRGKNKLLSHLCNMTFSTFLKGMKAECQSIENGVSDVVDEPSTK